RAGEGTTHIEPSATESASAAARAPRSFIPRIDGCSTGGSIQIDLSSDVYAAGRQPYHRCVGSIALKADLRAGGDVNRSIVPNAVRPGTHIDDRRRLHLHRCRPCGAVPEPRVINNDLTGATPEEYGNLVRAVVGHS